MSISSVAFICATGLLLAALPATAQTPDSSAAPVRPRGTLLKLGTGITPGFELSGYRGLTLPLVLGAEHHLTPEFSLYANGFTSFQLGRRNRYSDGSLDQIIGDYGFDAGIRYYYNQEKRRQKDRATGPFVGNYIALQTSSVFNPSLYRSHRYTNLTAIWGMQRRIGKYGWFDAYAGLGVGVEPIYHYVVSGSSIGRAGRSNNYGIAPELGIKFSLGSRLTH